LHVSEYLCFACKQQNHVSFRAALATPFPQYGAKQIVMTHVLMQDHAAKGLWFFLVIEVIISDYVSPFLWSFPQMHY
jgi:hypothetical protein